MGEAAHASGQGVYQKSLPLLLSFAMHRNLQQMYQLVGTLINGRGALHMRQGRGYTGSLCPFCSVLLCTEICSKKAVYQTKQNKVCLQGSDVLIIPETYWGTLWGQNAEGESGVGQVGPRTRISPLGIRNSFPRTPWWSQKTPFVSVYYFVSPWLRPRELRKHLSHLLSPTSPKHYVELFFACQHPYLMHI